MSEQPPARRVVAVPGWWSTVTEAEDATWACVSREDLVAACTHTFDGIAVATVELMPGVPVAWAGHELPSSRVGHLAELAHVHRRSGRAFAFCGAERLRERMTVAELVAASDVDAVVLPGAQECRRDVVVDGALGCRPHYRDGRLVLTVRPAPDGTVRPFERRLSRGASDVRTPLAH